MITEVVFSPVFDKDIQKNINNSPIWKEAYKPDEITNVRKKLHEYHIKFDGLKPIQVTKLKKIK
jgi:hypothetical protein